MKTKPQKILPFAEVYPSVESLQAQYHHKSKVIYLSTLFCLLAFLGATPLIEIDIQQQSRGIIRSVQENNQISMPLHGKIEAIYLKNDKPVEKGALLVKLDSRQIDQKLAQQHAQIEQYQAYLNDLNKLLHTNSNIFELETPVYQRAGLQFNKQIRQYELQIEQTKRAWSRADQLYSGGAIAKVEWEEKRYAYELQEGQQLQFIEQQKRSWAIESNDYESQIREIENHIAQLKAEKQQYYVHAPICGTVQQFSGAAIGNYVNPGQILGQITTHDSLLVEVYVHPGKIGWLSQGMPVRFQIDAFNYNQWGLAQGSIVSISKDINMIDGQAQFLIRCQLSQKSLFLKNGYEGELKKGMTLNARFQITRRSLYQLLYDKVDNWVNPQLI